MAMILSEMYSLNTKQFTYCKTSKVFVGEASTLGASLELMRKRIWDDACDEGFLLKSHKTGKNILMVFEEPTDPESYHEDGEVLARFNAYEMAGNTVKRLDFNLVVVND